LNANLSLPPLAELIDLGGKVAVITGAAQGIGAAIAGRLSEAGAAIILVDRNETALQSTCDSLSGRRRPISICGDVTEDDFLPMAAERAAKEFGGIDIWINNAGVAPRRPVLEITLDEWDSVMRLNLGAALQGAQLAARGMIAAGRQGVILNVLSSTVHRVSANPAHYRASKLGLLALTQNLAVDLGRYGIRVLGIAPGLTDTPLVRSLREQHGNEGFDEFIRRLPLRRIGTPDEMARVALFAVSGLASFMTGCVIDVDGGESQK
jgi:NAD(P)-dependent dehydrogenase (short-subunit alcohol dehydrogenase family)